MGLKRLSLLVLLALLVAAAFASSGRALAWDDSMCPDVAGENTNTCPPGTVGVSYSIRFREREGSGCGPDKQTFHYSSGALPPGLTLELNGTFSGIPTQAGTYKFYLEVREPTNDPAHCRGDTSQREFTLVINPGVPKLTIGPESAAPGTVGTPYSLQMTATVSDSKIWSIKTGALPPGLAINPSTGVISGTPTAIGTYTFEVLAKVAADQRSDTKVLGIAVRQPLTILGSSPFSPARRAASEVSVPFTAILSATGGLGAYTWSLSAGALPPGLSLLDGTIDGTPTVPGVYRFTTTVTDAEGRAANYPGTIGVAAKLAISTLLLRPAKVGHLYRMTLATTGGLLPKKWKVTSGPLPSGIRFDRTLGVLSGTPTRPGRYRVTFEATDALKVTSTKTLVINVLP